MNLQLLFKRHYRLYGGGFHTSLVNKLTSVFIPMALYGGNGYFSLDEYTQILYPSMLINSVHYILIRNFPGISNLVFMAHN